VIRLLEVEIKARCGDLKSNILMIGGKYVKTEIQEDMYYTHPCRDFKETDEALRIRKIGEKEYITYKGPKQDIETKTRDEIEFIVGPGLKDILLRLGFKEYGTVKKKRDYYTFMNLELCLDEVEGLGSFIEVESDNIEDKEKMFLLLEELDISREDCTTKTYLDLLEETGL